MSQKSDDHWRSLATFVARIFLFL